MDIYDRLREDRLDVQYLGDIQDTYVHLFLCRPVIIDTMIMDNSIIQFARFDVMQLQGKTIKD